MRYKIDRLVLKLLVLALLATSFPLTVLADVKDKGNVGDATGGSKSGGGLGWWDTFAGYRFAIVNQNFEQVSNTVDIVFDIPGNRVSNQNEWYTNSRANKLSYDRSNYSYITEERIYSNKDFKAISSHKYPPRPIESLDEDFISKGKEFKKWFLKDGGNVINSKPASSYSGSTGSGSSKSYSSVSSGSSGTTKPQEDISKSKDLSGVNESLLLRSVAYRNEKKA